VSVVDDDADLPGDGELGPVAVVLLVVGAALAIAGLTTLVPGWLLVVGVLTFAAGAVVPLWTSWRRRRRRDEQRSIGR
jgi:membrane protein implicated in regulation of membrane protease activity